MCDPVSVGLGLVGGMVASKALAPRQAAAPAAAMPDPAVEQARAEAEAAQKANTELANANRRRRGQQSLMATGAQATPSPATFGDSPGADGISPLGGIAPRMNRSTVAKRAASLMSGGAASPVMGGAPRGTPSKMQMLEL